MKEINSIPVVITRGNILYPGFDEIREIGRENSKTAIQIAIEKFDGHVILVSQKNITDGNPSIEGLFNLGVLARAKVTKEWKDGTISTKLSAIESVKIDSFEVKEGIFFANGEVIKNIQEINSELIEQLASKIASGLEIMKIVPTAEITEFIESKSLNSDLNKIIFSFAKLVKFIKLEKKVSILDCSNYIEQLNNLISDNEEKINNSEIDKEINSKIKSRMDKQQKEYYLREKMKAIKDELGDEGDDASSLESYKKRLEDEPYPETVKKRILSAISKLEAMQPGSSEANVERTWIEWMMNIPWWKETEDLKDLKHARDVLDSHHFGLEKVKDRIIEYLAVKQKTNSLKGQVITLVGPPGVGKTSLAKSIAESIGRNFVKVSLGGVRDEAEIRGHRKTYVGALPGRILQTMKRAKVKNPLFLLDEIDKMTSDQRGDPASAMLEVLDPEQNAEFSDHYIEEPYDLSKVLFVATANYLENIPEALYDRMEIIQLSSYTELEKMHIAKEYLVQRVLEEHALTSEEIQFTDEALNEIIKYYTREAGVRQLERHISKITRKFVVKLLNNELETIKVDIKIVNDYLGKRFFDFGDKQKETQVGVVTGLAYTQFGGDILPIEVNVMPGKGGLILTGKLGEVMKESAQIALGYVKSNAEKFSIKTEMFEKNDIHLHVPDGATPKDGPSAGITMTTAIISALTNKPVSKEIGMTGEITLRGNVSPIGGLREKSISASRSGLTKILIPIKNIRDLDEIPEEVKTKLEIKPMETYEEVYKEIFGNN